MQRRFIGAIHAAAAAVLTTAVGLGSAAAQEATKAQGAAKLAVAKKQPFGAYLTDGKGMSLYMFEKDKQGESACYDACAKAWPPLLTRGQPTAGPEVDKSKLSTIKRRDGAMQVAYNGMPLYHFAKDKARGQATGQDLEDFGAEWYLVSPTGEKITAKAEPKDQPKTAPQTGPKTAPKPRY